MGETLKDTEVYKPSKYNLFIPIKRRGCVLAYNSNSLALEVWDEKKRKAYDNLEKTGSCFEYTCELQKSRYIVDADTDETGVLQNDFDELKKGRGRVALTVVPTMDCNFECAYCYQGDFRDSGVMSDDTGGKILEYVRNEIRNGAERVHIGWYGGEPLLAKECIYKLSEKMMALCKEEKANYTASIVTNGYRLTKQVAAHLRSCRVGTAQISLDGGKALHDSRRCLRGGGPTYNVILNNLKEAITVDNFGIAIRVNIDKYNAGSIEALLVSLAENRFGSRADFRIYFAPVDGCSEGCLYKPGEVTGNTAVNAINAEDYARLEAKLHYSALRKKLGIISPPGRLHSVCAAIRPNSFVIMPDGDLHKCWNTVSDKSLRVGTLDDIDQVRQNGEQRGWLSWSPFDLPSCRNCLLLPSCAGFCAHIATARDNNQCDGLKYSVEHHLILLALSKGMLSEDDIDMDRYGFA